MIEYTSLWAFGTDCSSQELVNRLALVHGGNGVFSWTETMDSAKAAQFLLDELDMDTAQFNLEFGTAPIDNKPCVIFKDYGFATKYDVRKVPGFPKVDLAKLYDDNPWLREKLKRRYDKMMRELKDPTAKPVFIFLGHGAGAYSLPYNATYDPKRMRAIYDKLASHFPAEVGMVYLDYDPNWRGGSIINEDGRFMAIPHPISFPKRRGKQRETVTVLLNQLCPDLKTALVPSKDFVSRVAAMNPNIAACHCKHPGWEDNLILDAKKKEGYRQLSIHDTFDMLGYDANSKLTVHWRYWKSRETFVKQGDTWVFVKS